MLLTVGCMAREMVLSKSQVGGSWNKSIQLGPIEKGIGLLQSVTLLCSSYANVMYFGHPYAPDNSLNIVDMQLCLCK